MARNKSIPDSEVFQAILALIAANGEKAVALSAVARATGLAAPTLVQRFGTRAGMVQAALLSAWDAADAVATTADAGAAMTAKGAQEFLKLLGGIDISVLAASVRDAELRDRAAGWRGRVEAALAARLGSNAAALVFAAWQGQAIWKAAGGKGFRLKDAIKELG